MPVDFSEDPLRRLLCPPAGPWQSVECHAQVGSTNQVSLDRPLPWRVVAAAHQTHGRGRHSRVWETRAGSSVALSLTVPLSGDAASWGWLPLITGLAVVEALGELAGRADAFALKWPNDVLLRDEAGDWGKVCGILCETAPHPAGAGMLVVAGVGVNLTQTGAELPVPTATSLALAGLTPPGPGDVVAAVSQSFAHRYEQWYAGGPGLELLRAAYRTTCDTVGREVAVHLPDEQTVTGRAVDVAEDGEIVVDTQTGRRSFAAGDVIHLRPQASSPRA